MSLAFRPPDRVDDSATATLIVPDARRRIHSAPWSLHALAARRNGVRVAEALPQRRRSQLRRQSGQAAEITRNTSRAAAMVSSMSCALWALLTKPAS